MLASFAPALVIGALVGLSAGAAAGHFLGQRLSPSQRVLVAMGLTLALVASVMAGASVPDMVTAASQSSAGIMSGLTFAVTRQVVLIGLLMGASLFLLQKHLSGRLFGFIGCGLIGLPMATNFWFAAGAMQTFSTL